MLTEIVPDAWPVFLFAALMLNITPGSDFLYCLNQGLHGGPRKGVIASFGIASGSLLHSLFAVSGLSALLAIYPLAFDVLRWAGAAYLLWLAWRTWHTPAFVVPASNVEPVSSFDVWRNGTLVNLLNPKVAVFILAFIPQFVDPQAGSPVLQFLLLGLLFNVTGTSINACVGIFGGSLARLLRHSPELAENLARISAIVFVLLAVRLFMD